MIKSSNHHCLLDERGLVDSGVVLDGEENLNLDAVSGDDEEEEEEAARVAISVLYAIFPSSEKMSFSTSPDESAFVRNNSQLLRQETVSRQDQ
jgi:hypothetical protein